MPKQTWEDKLKLRRANSSPMTGWTWKKRSLGNKEPYDLAQNSEQTQEEMVNERQELRRKAIFEATMTERREPLARKLYNGDGFTHDDWPALQAMTAQERTVLIEDVRQIFGMRRDGKKA